MPESISTQSRYRGCLLGLAVGDAIGTSVEFMDPGSFNPVTDMTGGGPFTLLPGEWTDDTSMALCLAESLSEKGGFDPLDQLERYVRWYRTGYLSSNGRFFDIGNATAKALQRFELTHEPYPGSDSTYSAGNGSLMRLAPVPMFYLQTSSSNLLDRCADSSRTTHANVKSVDACRYFGALLYGALIGQSKTVLISPPSSWQFLDSSVFDLLANLTPEILDVSNGSFLHKNPPTIQGKGYVVLTLEAALWAFSHSSSYREGVLMAANLGDDADTTAAIYGQLAGAYYGEQGIPEEWRVKLALKVKIINYADRLWELSRL